MVGMHTVVVHRNELCIHLARTTMAVDADILHELLLETGGRFATTSERDAYAFCERMASSHYENFPVASRLVRSDVRPHIAAVYAFARLADDIADELQTDVQEKERLLQTLLDSLRKGGQTSHPVIRSMSTTMARCSLPFSLPERLIRAFSMDSSFRQPDTWNDVLEYCRYSANPVGETVLRIHGVHDTASIAFSDRICTALQLINFWQDQSVDHPRGRCYIPKDLCAQYGVRYVDGRLEAADPAGGRPDPQRLGLLNDILFTRTRELMTSGRPILTSIDDRRLRAELSLIIESATRLLERCTRMHEELLDKRPTLGFGDLPIIALRAIPSYFA